MFTAIPSLSPSKCYEGNKNHNRVCEVNAERPDENPSAEGGADMDAVVKQVVSQQRPEVEVVASRNSGNLTQAGSKKRRTKTKVMDLAKKVQSLRRATNEDARSTCQLTIADGFACSRTGDVERGRPPVVERRSGG